MPLEPVGQIHHVARPERVGMALEIVRRTGIAQNQRGGVALEVIRKVYRVCGIQNFRMPLEPIGGYALDGHIRHWVPQVVGALLLPFDQQQYDRNLAAARTQADPATFKAAWADGHAMSLEHAVAYALEARQSTS